MDYRSLLNENQYKAVSTNSQYVRVVAGAGSGKTRVLTYRLSYLISEKGVDPYSIVAIAFTNKVAAEMKTRASNLLGGKFAGLSVSTFHSFCAKFLRKEIDILDYPNNFTILDEEDVTSLIKDIGVSLGYKRNDELVKYSINYIGYNKCVGRYPSDIVIGNDYVEAEKIALKIYHQYETRKAQMLSLDFDDLLLKTIEILENYPEVREKWQNRINHILVDEFQDTNDVQYKLIKLLMNAETSLYVVGDPDQTIYTWRGANQNIIMNFNKNFFSAETIILDRNYRSTANILECSNKLIAHNKKRVPKDLYTENVGGESVICNILSKREEEAKYVVDEIEKLHRQGNSYKDIAVLYRASYLTLPFENELMRRRIPYRVYGGMKFFQRKEVKDVLAYFRLLYNQKDDISFERIVNVPRRGLGDSTLSILKVEKDSHGLSYLEYIDQIENFETDVKPKHVMVLTALLNKIKEIRTRLEENLEAYSKVLEDFIVELGYYEYLESDDDTCEERVGNVKALFENITAFLKENPESTFDQYLENAALQSSQDELNDEEQVSLMTIHVAKGLEFNFVFVISVMDGIFPSARTLDESGHDGIEEERRLCYVAFTRAKEKLFVTANTGYSFVLNSFAIKSRFIEEAGLHTVRKSFNNNFERKCSTENEFGFYSQEPTNYESFYKKDIPETPKTNGITDWKIGDVAIHQTFGKGVVINIIDDTIIEIDFESNGRKSILSNHPKLSREEKGAEA